MRKFISTYAELLTEEEKMITFQEAMIEYQRQLEKGVIQQAYKGLMDYLLSLKTYFKAKYPDSFVSGSLYSGYMDMSYFSFIPDTLKQRNLKIAVVFNHPAFRFEVWLSGYNKQVQTKYWKLICESDWQKYKIVASPQGADSIIESVLADPPDFRDLDTLTAQIERGTLAFASDIEQFLSTHDV